MGYVINSMLYMKRPILIITVLLISLTVVVFSKEKKPVILAEHFESSGDFIIYTKNVELITELYTIFADRIKYNTKTKGIIARGRVTMTSENMSVSGSELVFNISDMKGVMYDVQGMMEPAVSFSVEKLVQADKDTQKFKKMKFTSCTQLVPRWLLSARKGKIKKDKYIEMKDVVLKVKNIPILYLPYLRYPIGDKSTGFLFPVIGNSDKLGFFTKNSFFWEIKSNLDLTLSHDYISKIGNGYEADFRYLFRMTEGDIKLYVFDYSQKYHDSLKDGEEIKDKDYNINVKHIQRINFLKTVIKANVNYQSNPQFKNLFAKDFGRYNTSRFNSSISLRSSISNLSISVLASRNETYYIQKKSSNVITKFPSVNLILKQQKFWKLPGYFSIKGGFESVKRTGINYEEDVNFANDVTSNRFSFIPSYTLSFIKLPWITATADLSSKHSFYLKSQDPKTKKIVNEPLHLNYNTAKLTLTGPSFYKIYKTKFSRMKHVIEPEIKVSYSTKVDDLKRKRVIPIDLFDYPSYSSVNFSINSRLFKKKNSASNVPREIMTYSISQKYYFDPIIANRYRSITVNGKKVFPSFSELINNLRYNPTKDISANITFAYNHYLETFQRINLTLAYSNINHPVSGRLTYSIYTNPFKKKSFFLNTKLLKGDFDINFPNFPIRISGAIDYDLIGKKFRYGSVIASYNYQCIKINAEMKIYTSINGKSHFEYILGVTLGNLGIVKDFFGGDK